ncbi:MAG: PfkB family carbohydrate kinase [Phaeovulum sp.]|uniref:carbohydrate kinase family protein n=1 Tax=Phaeovulum sp. TaxID=2934796 RepID=UPI002730D0C5|nr:PfkB family carbohydrate kinase [Phaeovulum sp.]MDP2062849.1 PfkB family carbohydrate kinase [Phaeovulum sp.]
MSASSRSEAVLCTGRLYCDIVMSGLSGLPSNDAEVYAETLVLAAGGGAYITAAYLAALGRPSGLAALLPAAPFDAAIAAELAASGVDLAACPAAPPGAAAQITVAMVSGGDRAFLTHRGGPAVPATLAEAIASGRYRHLHLGELATLAEAPEVVAQARAAGLSVSADCAWDAAVLARPDSVALLAGVDVFLPNRAEARALMRHAPIAQHAPLVVIKDGAAGAEAIQNGTSLRRPALAQRVVDTVGAGDAFNAGFLDAWLAGASLSDCLDAGAGTAALALSRVGGARGLIGSGLFAARQFSAAE